MRNLLSKGLVVVAGFTGLPAMFAQSDPQSPEKVQLRANEDPRISSLQRFFERHNSPAQSLSDVFIREADINGLDWRLLPGLALVETGGGKHCQLHNLFGWANGKASFSSFAEGIRHVAWFLSNSSRYRNKSVDGLLYTFNHNPGYGKKVKLVMEWISPTVEIAMAEQ